MDLSQNTQETIGYMVDKIVTKIKMVNTSAVQFKNMGAEEFEELKDIYEMVQRKDHFSPSEMQALAEELGRLRKK
ncbi:DUF1128 domain-containing protein [Lederbergia sp. NSJ-179]|uniref:DUF1128 domain-containing protein n=1 Tax=Lederbergia sp. NSJ-179 TaxID=2931402 RepID=UPI001FD0863B|nr:DUF1128 domain-containing protein [Lederbergia sp. NSJ-179]MCJ7840828.1 DUF1128 domain-containing protein [Lederbergia sp. NSJ-179]